MKSKKLSEIKGFENCKNYIIYEDGSIYSKRLKRFMKLPKDSSGYLCLDIRRTNSICKYPKVHRLVMLAFSKEKPKEQVNHIDGNKENNHISNLEWVSNEDNRRHAVETGLMDSINYGIAQYDLEGNLLNVFHTAKEAIQKLGIKNGESGNIGRCIRGNRKTAYGYIWKQY